MQTIRRIYLYAVTFVSLEVVLWGVISLARSIAAGNEIGGSVNRLAGALALILVGIPIFLIHWSLAQRGAAKKEEESTSRLRALFLYGTLLATLIPIAQNALALLDHLFSSAFGLAVSQAMLGGNQSTSDNLIAIAINALAAAYFFHILRSGWSISPPDDNFIEVRRLYRYIWLVYGLVMLVFGVQQILLFILQSPQTVGLGISPLLANGLSLLIVGAPLWVLAGRVIQRSLAGPAESQSLLRLVVLYGLAIVSVSGLLAAASVALKFVLQVAFGARPGLAGFLAQIGKPFSIAVPFGATWAYYGRMLYTELGAMPDQPRRAGLRRFYDYILALLGLAASFIGLQLLLAFILEQAISPSLLGSEALSEQLALALSIIAVGLPLWVIVWRPVARGAAQEGESGDHARRSVIRKAYLFLALFAGVMGIMFGAGMLLYQVIRALLGQPSANLLLDVAQQFKITLLFGLLAVFHWQALRMDGRMAERSLAKRYAQFPVLVLVSGESPEADNTIATTGEAGTNGESTTPLDFADQIVNALQKQSPALPVAIHPTNLGAPDEALSAARAVILPSELMAKPPEAIRLWLQSFPGSRLVVPTPARGWRWVVGSQSLSTQARQAAQIVRQLAEGETPSSLRENSTWQVVVYILAGLFLLELILSLVATGASLILR